MKRFIQTCSFIGLLLVLLVSAQAQISKTYRVEIPFDFNIGQETYRAGTYRLSFANSILVIRNQKTNEVKAIAAQSALEKAENLEAPQFFFDQTAGKKTLVEIAGRDFNVKLETAPTARDVVALYRAQPPADR